MRQADSEIQAVFDDARLYRLGSDQLGTLPPGVVAGAPYRITVHPDGRVDFGALQRRAAAIGNWSWGRKATI